MATAPLWEAVAVSLDTEPSSLVREKPVDPSDAADEFRRRLQIACSHVVGGGLECLAYGDTPQNPVNLAVFGAWARSIGWRLPEWFPASPPVPAAPSNEESSETRAARLRARMEYHKSRGGRDYTAKTAKEEGISTERLRQILRLARKASSASPFDVVTKPKR